jgi:hypothetical protein
MCFLLSFVKFLKLYLKQLLFLLDMFNFLSHLTLPSKDHRNFLKFAASLLVFCPL